MTKSTLVVLLAVVIVSVTAVLWMTIVGNSIETTIATTQIKEKEDMDVVCSENDGVTRTYYIAADEIVWDYAPLKVNQMKGMQFNEDENVFVERSTDRIGSEYIKAVYHQYTDGTFTNPMPRTAEWEHLGILGPVIHAEVCDTIEVVFKNNSDMVKYSVHPHGVFYEKDSEGAGSFDRTSGSDKADDAIAPGETYTYVWPVPPHIW